MKSKKTYLKGKSLFIVSLCVIITTVLTVYLTGFNYQRTVTDNTYLSLIVIAFALFIFMAVGLYRGVGLIDDFPKSMSFKVKEIMPDHMSSPEIETGHGVEGFFVSLLIWIGVAILMIIALLLFEMVIFASIAFLLASLYWVFFRAMKLVFAKASITKANLLRSTGYSLFYTVLFVGWIFLIVFATEQIKMGFN